jgi:hypothetical protein
LGIREEFQLADPWRHHNNPKEDGPWIYTFVPKVKNRNSSRIDFFLISKSLLAYTDKFSVDQFITSSYGEYTFDHKHILLKLHPEEVCDEEVSVDPYEKLSAGELSQIINSELEDLVSSFRNMWQELSK